MFTRWGDLVYRFRFAVIIVVGGAMVALGAYGMGLGPRLSQSGWFDPGSESVQGAQIADGSYGRDHMADVIVMYNAPADKTIDDPEFSRKIVDSLTRVVAEHPDQISKINGAYWKIGDAQSAPSAFGSKDKKHAFASIAIAGDNDTVMMANYRAVADVFAIPGVDVEVSGLQPIAVTLTDTIDHDSKRMEVLAFPAVAVLLFFIFGGIVAAALPLIIGGLTIIGATGIVMVLTNFTEVNSFVTGVVSMIGLGLAIDYGLFIVSRFREELAEGYTTRAAVRRSVMTAGRTVLFSATMIIASLGGVLIFPQGFLRSVAYGTIAAVSLAALSAITILPAMLGILGPRVDMLGLKWFRKTKTAEQVENGFWGNLTRWVMKHPLKIAIPVTVILLLLIIPVKNLAFGGINEKYLPPDNPTRAALEHFYEVFPLKKTDPIQLVFVSDNTNAIGKVWKEANQAPGLVGPFEVPVKSPTNPEVFRTSATLVDPTNNAEPTIDYLRSIEIPDGVTMYVTGQPALMADSIDTLMELMPWMILIVLLTTFVLMFLTFGSLVLPIKAALMSALGLGSTLGILTWIFIDGNGSGLLNFTPQPISAPVLMLIIAIIYGLSTDYEVFLLSRMVEARAQGASTTEAVRIGTAQTGRIITAAALILLVVTGAFAFSDMVMMQYIAYGMIAALFIDATVLRMLLVPAIMKLLGDDCWWAPKWMKRIQEKIGLGEPILDDERPQKGSVVDLVKTTPITDPPTMQMTVVPDSKLAKTPRRPRTVAEIEAEAPTAHLDKITEHNDPAKPARPRPPMSPDPTRPRAPMLSSGEPTQVLPVVQPDAEAPKSDKGPADSSTNQPDTPSADLSYHSGGEPTQILPIVKPGAEAPKSDQEQGDSTSGPDNRQPTPRSDLRSGAPGTSGLDTPGTSGSNPPGATGFTTQSETGPGISSTPGISTPRNSSFGTQGDTALGTPSISGLSAPRNSGLDTPGYSGNNTPGSSGFATPDDPGTGMPGDSLPGMHGFGTPGESDPNTQGRSSFGTSGDSATSAHDRTGIGTAGDAGPGSQGRFRPVPESTSGAAGSSISESGVIGGHDSSAPDTSGVIGGGRVPGVDSPGRNTRESAPRGSQRVQPPAGYTPPARGGDTSAPRASTPSDAPEFGRPAEDSGSRPSIVNPVRPSMVNTPPPGVVPPPAPSIVNTPPRVAPPSAPNIVNPPPPSMVTPTPRPVEPPAGGTFSGFTPLTGYEPAPGTDATEQSAPEPESRGTEPESRGFVPPTDLSVAPGAHRAEPPANNGVVRPVPDAQRPVPNAPRPATDATRPMADAQRPATDAPRPAPNAPRPSADAPRPVADVPRPVTDAPRPATDAPRPAADAPQLADESSARGVFGTPVPVETQPRSPWSPAEPATPSGFRAPETDGGPRFSPVTPAPEQDSAQPEVVRPQVAPPGFTAVTPGEATPASWQPAAAQDNPADTPGSWQPEPADVRNHPADTPASWQPERADVRNHQPDTPASWRTESAEPQDNPAATPAPWHAELAAAQDHPAARSASWRTESAEPQDNPAATPASWHAEPADAQDNPAATPASWQTEPAEPQGNPADAPGQWQAPAGFTAVPAPGQEEQAGATSSPDDGASPAPESDAPQADSRDEIENWMAQLRSSRRGSAADEGRHHGNEGRTVSVNELLRRREDDSD
ncbi:MMPL family transporter [Nocardia sp. NPDC055053]